MTFKDKVKKYIVEKGPKNGQKVAFLGVFRAFFDLLAKWPLFSLTFMKKKYIYIKVFANKSGQMATTVFRQNSKLERRKL